MLKSFFSKLIDRLMNDRQKLLWTISVRNLVRQRRRNLLLAMAIAIGMMVLVLTGSWAHGITDLLLNKMMVYAFGHVQVTQSERGRFQQDIVRDKQRIVDAVRKSMSGVVKINETCTAFTRIIGNGKADFVAIVGIDPERFKKDGFGGMTVLEGNIWNFTNKSLENPIMIYEEKAKDLNIHAGDTVKARLTTINGQEQSARFHVITILKSVGFMQSMAAFTPLSNIKSLMGYRPWESGAIQVVLKKPQSAIRMANLTQTAMKPGFAVIEGRLSAGGSSADVRVLSYYRKSDILGSLTSQAPSMWQQKAAQQRAKMMEMSARKRGAPGKRIPGATNLRKTSPVRSEAAPAAAASTNRTPLEVLTAEFRQIEGSFAANSNEHRIAVSENVAKTLGLRPGSKVTLSYADKFGGGKTSDDLTVSCVYADAGRLPANSALLHERNFNDVWYDNLPLSAGKYRSVVASNSPLAGVLMKEWILLRRSPTMDDMQKKFKLLSRARLKSGFTDVSSMYETFDVVVKMESTITLITGIMVMILFFVILVGVVNTLNMTIRERTREIGTVRSIGMQSNDVRDTFLLEVLLLSVAACAAGIAAGFLLMGLLSLLPIRSTGMFSMFLNQGHLHFVPLIGNLITIAWLVFLFLLIYRFIDRIGPRVRPLLMALLFTAVALVSIAIRILIVKLTAGVGWLSAAMGGAGSLGPVMSLALLVYGVALAVFFVLRLLKKDPPGRRGFFFTLTLVALCAVFVYFGAANGEILPSMMVIVLLSVVTAFYPSRRAANMSAANALRHYE